MAIKIRGITVVMLGAFSPSQFSPMWLRHHNLISQPACDNAKIHIIHQGICAFKVENFDLNIESKRFVVSTIDQSSFERLRDLIQGIMTVSTGTPIGMLGVNYQIHFDAGSVEKWHKVGDTFVPKDFWKKSLGATPGMKSLIVQGENPFVSGDVEGKVQVKVEPSVKVTNGVFVEVNNHSEFKDPKDPTKALEFLTSKWEEIEKHSMKIIEEISEVANS